MKPAPSSAAVARSHGVDEVVKVKSIATDEIGLNERLAAEGILAVETDLAELIIQLDDDFPSHILVPAIHRNRAEIRDIFRRELGLEDLTDEPEALAEAARLHLRAKFLSARMGVSGANFAVAETGSVCVFESEGNGRMCTTLPEVLVTVMGVEKVVPSWRDMEVFLQLLPRSSTGERMNPYTSVWSGAGDDGRQDAAGADGPREFHLVLLDNGRVHTLADEVGRQALRCIRCSACLNVCPVYARVGGHAYGSVYPGPIGAILTPQLKGIEGDAGSLPYASSLCGACGDVCPVKIEIPRLLTHLRAREVASRSRLDPETLTMKALFHTFSSRQRYERAQKLARTASRPLARGGHARKRAPAARSPGRPGRWRPGRSRASCPAPAPETFREWWRRTRGAPAAAADSTAPPAHSICVLHAYRAKRDESGGRAAAPGPAGDARTHILQSIRAALGDASKPDIPRNYRTEDERPRDEIVTLFAERVAEYRATVHRAGAGEVAEAVRRHCRGGGRAPDRHPGRSGRGMAAGRGKHARARGGRRPFGAGTRRSRRRPHRLRRRHRGDRHLRPRRRCGAGSARAHARAGSPHLRRARGSGGGARAGGRQGARGGGAGGSSAHVRLRDRPRRRTSSWIASRACMARACSMWCSWPDAHRLPGHIRVRGHGARPAGREPAPAAARGHPSGRPARAAVASSPPRRWRRPHGCSASRSSSRRT